MITANNFTSHDISLKRLLPKSVCKMAKTSIPSKRQPTATLWSVFNWISNPNFSENPVLKYQIKKVTITSQSFSCKLEFFSLSRIPDICQTHQHLNQSNHCVIIYNAAESKHRPCRLFFPFQPRQFRFPPPKIRRAGSQASISYKTRTEPAPSFISVYVVVQILPLVWIFQTSLKFSNQFRIFQPMKKILTSYFF